MCFITDLSAGAPILPAFVNLFKAQLLKTMRNFGFMLQFCSGPGAFFFIIIFLQFWCLCLVLASVIPSEQNCAPSKFRECCAWEHLDCSKCWKWRNSLSLLLFSSSPNRLSWKKKPPLVSWRTNPYFSQTLLYDYFMLCSFPCQNF